jgi:hypothetical protein
VSYPKPKKFQWLAQAKQKFVEKHGCSECGKGKVEEGFIRFYEPDPPPYNPRQFTLKNADPLTVTQLANKSGVTQDDLQAAIDKSVVICRACMAVRQGHLVGS